MIIDRAKPIRIIACSSVRAFVEPALVELPTGVVAVGENEPVVLYDIANYEPPDGGPLGNTVLSVRMTVDKA